MVSVAGYGIHEYLLAMAGSYILWSIYVLMGASLVVAEKDFRNVFKGVFEKLGAVSGAIALVVVGCLAIFGIYLLPLRVGSVMMINGMLILAIVQVTPGVVKAWYEVR